jgi:hypothetical protein
MSDTSFVLRAGKPTIEKDPNARLDYTADFTKWLDAMTDALQSHVVTNVVGVTVDSSLIVGKTVVVWVTGGTVGSAGSVTVRVTTVGGRTDDRTMYFKIKER